MSRWISECQVNLVYKFWASQDYVVNPSLRTKRQTKLEHV